VQCALVGKVSAAQDTLVLLLLSPTSHVEASSGLKVLPPGSYTNLQSLLVLKLPGLPGWLSWSQMLLWLLSLLSCVGLPSMLLGLWLLLRGTCTCGFVIRLASLFLMLEMSVCSCVRQLFGWASVASDGLGGVAVIDEGGGGVRS